MAEVIETFTGHSGESASEKLNWVNGADKKLFLSIICDTKISDLHSHDLDMFTYPVRFQTISWNAEETSILVPSVHIWRLFGGQIKSQPHRQGHR